MRYSGSGLSSALGLSALVVNFEGLHYRDGVGRLPTITLISAIVRRRPSALASPSVIKELLIDTNVKTREIEDYEGAPRSASYRVCLECILLPLRPRVSLQYTPK